MSGRAGKRSAQRQRGEFSSDDELVRRSPRFGGRKQTSKTASQSTYMSEVCQLEDEELVEELKRYGEDPGPIMDNTRGLYQRKLARLMAEKTKESSQARSEEMVDYGTDQLGEGEWSSHSSEGDTDPEAQEEEEEEAGVLVEEPPARKLRSNISSSSSSKTREMAYVSYSTPTRHVESSYLLRKPKDTPTKAGEDRSGQQSTQKSVKQSKPRPSPSRQAPPTSKPRPQQQSPSIWSSVLSLALLLVMFAVTFLVYDYSQNQEASFVSHALSQLRDLGVLMKKE